MYKRIKHRHQIKEIALLISLMGLQNLVYADNVIAFDGDEVTIQGGSYKANNSLGAAIIAREGRLTNINNELILINNRGTEGGNGANLQVNGHFSSPRWRYYSSKHPCHNGCYKAFEEKHQLPTN